MDEFMRYFLTNHLGVDLIIIISLSANLIKSINGKEFKEKFKDNPIYESSIVILASVLIILYILIDFHQITDIESAILYYFVFTVIIIGAKIISIKQDDDH